MKQSVNRISLFLSLFLLGGLLACEKQTDLAPLEASTEQQTLSPSSGIVLATTKYVLTKHGNTVLTYDRDGQLKKATLSPTHYIDYTYQEGKARRVFTKEYINNTLSVATTYYLQPAQATAGSNDPSWQDYPDRCYQMTTERYIHFPGRDKLSTTTYLYGYTSKGQVHMVYVDDLSIGLTLLTAFAYDTNGDLTKVTEYKENKKFRESTFTYTAFGDPIRNDRNGFNPEALPVDPYVGVFGNYSNHLARAKKVETLAPYNLVSDHYYQYQINSDGYVTKRDTYTLLNAQLIESMPFEYLVTAPRGVE